MSFCGANVKIGVTRGCSQGGILSPILWCMVIDSLLCSLNEAGMYTQGYSHDVFTLICRDYERTVGDLMRTAIKLVEEWCEEKGLRVNPVKTKIVSFRMEKRQLAGEFQVFGKYLTVTFW